MPSLGNLRRVALVITDVFEEYIDDGDGTFLFTSDFIRATRRHFPEDGILQQFVLFAV
jgi:spermidine synthase